MRATLLILWSFFGNTTRYDVIIITRSVRILTLLIEFLVNILSCQDIAVKYQKSVPSFCPINKQDHRGSVKNKKITHLNCFNYKIF